MTSLIWRLAPASYTALAADHLVPVLTSGCTWRMTSSGESRSIKWSLAFPTLNSSVMDEKGSWSIPVAVQGPTVEKQGGHTQPLAEVLVDVLLDSFNPGEGNLIDLQGPQATG